MFIILDVKNNLLEDKYFKLAVPIEELYSISNRTSTKIRFKSGGEVYCKDTIETIVSNINLLKEKNNTI